MLTKSYITESSCHIKKKEHGKGALQGLRCRTSFCYNCYVTLCGHNLLFFRRYYGLLVTVAMETRPAVPDWDGSRAPPTGYLPVLLLDDGSGLSVGSREL